VRKRTAGGEPDGVRQSLIEALSSRRFFFLTDENEEAEEGSCDDQSDDDDHDEDYGAEWSDGSGEGEDNWASVREQLEERALVESEAERGEPGEEKQAAGGTRDEQGTTSDTARREEP
jgi:hypothetical protein